MAGMVPGDAVEIASARLSIFAQDDQVEPHSYQNWLPTWRGACLICNMANMVGSLICFGCQSVCLFALRHGDLNQFTPIGVNVIRSTMKAVYRPILMKDMTKEKKVSFCTVSDFSVLARAQPLQF